MYGAQNERDRHGSSWKIRRLIETEKPLKRLPFCRENAQSRILSVPARRIPSRFGNQIFERKEVKTLFVFARRIEPQSKSDFARIAGVPPRGIGKVTLEKCWRENH